MVGSARSSTGKGRPADRRPRARASTRTTQGPPARGSSRPAPGHGVPAWRRTVSLGLATLVGAALASTVWAVATRPEPVEQLIAADAARDVQRVEELVALARQGQDDLAPVMGGLATALPADGAPTAGDPVEAAAWSTTATQVAETFDDPPSAGTAVNVARGALASATDQLVVATDTYVQALAAESEAQQRLLELAVRQRDAAVMTWSVGATQLDVVSIDAGFGHVHVFLDGSGAFSPDDAPEGSGAHDGDDPPT